MITSRTCLLPVAVIKCNPYLLPVAVIKCNPYLLPVAVIKHSLHLLPVAVIKYNPYLLLVAVIRYNPYLLPVAVIKHSLHLLPVAVIKYSLHLLPDCRSFLKSSGTMFCHLLVNLLTLIGKVAKAMTPVIKKNSLSGSRDHCRLFPAVSPESPTTTEDIEQS